MSNPDAIQVAANYYSQLCDATELITELRREVAMLRKELNHSGCHNEDCAIYGPDHKNDGPCDCSFGAALDNTQATALAYEMGIENRGAVKALEDAKHKILELHFMFEMTQALCTRVIDSMILELCVNKGEVK